MEVNMKITKDERELLLFMALGDGHLDKKGTLSIVHCEKQKEYIEWKYNLIKKFTTKQGVRYFINNTFPSYKFNTTTYNFLRLYRKILYTPKKTISRKILNKLTPLGIYIWYMDDGGMSRLKLLNGKFSIKEIMLNTGLQKEDNQIIIDYFKEVWGVSFGQAKNNKVYRLRCGNKEAIKFLNIIKEYHNEVPSMSYKINPNSY